MPRETPVATPIELDPTSNSTASLDQLCDQLVHGGDAPTDRQPPCPAPRLLEIDADLKALLAELDQELASVSQRLNSALAR